MTIRRDPSTLHGAIEAAVNESGGYAVAADIIAKPEKWLRDASNPDRDPAKAGQLTYAHARQLTRAGVLALAQDLAALAGMALVPLDTAEGIPAADVMAKGADIMREAGEAAVAFAAAAADGNITEAERKDLLREAQDVERAVGRAKRMLAGTPERGD